MGKLELTLHSEKTRLIDMYFGKDSFDFLGFNNRFQRFRNKNWQWYWTLQQIPSKKTMKKMRANIKEMFASPSKLLLNMEEMVKLLNLKIIGMQAGISDDLKHSYLKWLHNNGKVICYTNVILNRGFNNNFSELYKVYFLLSKFPSFKIEFEEELSSLKDKRNQDGFWNFGKDFS